MSHLLTLHDPAAARKHYESGIWRTDTMYSPAREHATQRGSAWAVRDSQRRLTWSELVAGVDAVSADLHEAGLRRGVRVSTWLPNRLESIADWGQNDDTVLLTLSPMSHHIGTVTLEEVLVTGCELVMYDAPAAVSPLDWILTRAPLMSWASLRTASTCCKRLAGAA